MTVRNPCWLQSKLYPAISDRAVLETVAGGVEQVRGVSSLIPSLSSGVTTAVSSGKALVKGDTNVGQGFYLFECTASETQVHTRDATNPRVNMLVVRVYDSTEVGSGSDGGAIEIIAGTPTPGANLTNLSGIATLPDSAMLIAYVLVPTSGSAGVLDRRSIPGSFSIYRSAALAPTNGAASKINYDATEWNYANIVDVSNGRFTPLTPGIWRLSAFQYAGIDSYIDLYIYKNGSLHKTLDGDFPSGSAAGVDSGGTATAGGTRLVSANGITDYFEIYTKHGEAGAYGYDTGINYCNFQGEYVGNL